MNMDTILRLFERPVVALLLAAIAGMIVESILWRMVGSFLSWCWAVALAYASVIKGLVLWVVYIGIAVAIGYYVFLEPIEQNEVLLDTVLKYGYIAVRFFKNVTANIGREVPPPSQPPTPTPSPIPTQPPLPSAVPTTDVSRRKHRLG